MMANPIKDQHDAAAKDAENRLRAVSEKGEHEVRVFGPVARQIVDYWFEHAGEPDEHAMCRHVAGTPQVVFSAAAFPGVATCADCFTEMWHAYTGFLLKCGHGRPCDGCHQFAEAGKTGVMAVGPMLMTISMCGVCCAIEDAGAP